MATGFNMNLIVCRNYKFRSDLPRLRVGFKKRLNKFHLDENPDYSTTRPFLEIV